MVTHAQGDDANSSLEPVGNANAFFQEHQLLVEQRLMSNA